MKKSAFMFAFCIAAAVFGAEPYQDLPPEVKTAKTIKQFDGKMLGRYTNGKIAKDPVSSMEKSSIWVPEDQKLHKFPIPLGICNREINRTICRIYLKEAPADEKYHWYKIGTAVIAKRNVIYAADWSISINVNDIFQEGGDNEYEVWASFKIQGPAYVKGSTKTNELALDRAVLIKK